MSSLSTTEARSAFSKIISKVEFGGDRIVLERRGKDVAALVSIEDLELLRAIEDQIDIEAARKALRSKKRIPLAKVKKALGL